MACSDETVSILEQSRDAKVVTVGHYAYMTLSPPAMMRMRMRMMLVMMLVMCLLLGRIT